jgi:GAF domain
MRWAASRQGGWASGRPRPQLAGLNDYQPTPLDPDQRTPEISIAFWDATQQVLGFFPSQPDARPGQVAEQSVGQLIAGQAFAEQRPIFAPNAAREDPAQADSSRASGAVAVLASPITAGQTRLGVLTMYAPPASIFAEADLALAHSLADPIALALGYARQERATLRRSRPQSARAHRPDRGGRSPQHTHPHNRVDLDLPSMSNVPDWSAQVLAPARSPHSVGTDEDLHPSGKASTRDQGFPPARS